MFGQVPGWLSNLAAMNGVTFGLGFPPVILIWIAVAIALIYGMKNTVYGRYLYALGGNRTSAQRISISERRYWIGAFAVIGLRLGADRVAAAGLERRRLHRRRRPLSVHDAGRGGDRRHLAARRRTAATASP